MIRRIITVPIRSQFDILVRPGDVVTVNSAKSHTGEIIVDHGGHTLKISAPVLLLCSEPIVTIEPQQINDGKEILET